MGRQTQQLATHLRSYHMEALKMFGPPASEYVAHVLHERRSKPRRISEVRPLGSRLEMSQAPGFAARQGAKFQGAFGNVLTGTSKQRKQQQQHQQQHQTNNKTQPLTTKRVDRDIWERRRSVASRAPPGHCFRRSSCLLSAARLQHAYYVPFWQPFDPARESRLVRGPFPLGSGSRFLAGSCRSILAGTLSITHVHPDAR